MAALDPDDPDSVETADLIADALVVPDRHDRHWSDSSQTLLRGIMRHVAFWHGYKGCRNLPTVRKLVLHGSIDLIVDIIDRDGARDDERLSLNQLQKEMLANEDLDGLIQDAAARGRITRHHGLVKNVAVLIHDADCCQFRSNIQSGIVRHGHFSFDA